jgi:hypothetical protein
MRVMINNNNNNRIIARFLSSALVQFRTWLLRDTARHRLVVGYGRFGTTSFPSSEERQFKKNRLLDSGRRER